MVIGFEFYKTIRSVQTATQFVQWTFYSKAKNPILLEVIKSVVENVKARHVHTEEKARIDAVEQTTGPVAWSTVIMNFIANYASVKGFHEIPRKKIGYPKALYDIKTINKNGQLLPLYYNGTVINLLILPYRAFATHPRVGTGAVGPQQIVKHTFRGSWKHQQKVFDSTE